MQTNWPYRYLIFPSLFLASCLNAQEIKNTVPSLHELATRRVFKGNITLLSHTTLVEALRLNDLLKDFKNLIDKLNQYQVINEQIKNGVEINLNDAKDHLNKSLQIMREQFNKDISLPIHCALNNFNVGDSEQETELLDTLSELLYAAAITHHPEISTQKLLGFVNKHYKNNPSDTPLCLLQVIPLYKKNIIEVFSCRTHIGINHDLLRKDIFDLIVYYELLQRSKNKKCKQLYSIYLMKIFDKYSEESKQKLHALVLDKKFEVLKSPKHYTTNKDLFNEHSFDLYGHDVGFYDCSSFYPDQFNCLNSKTAFSQQDLLNFSHFPEVDIKKRKNESFLTLCVRLEPVITYYKQSLLLIEKSAYGVSQSFSERAKKLPCALI